MVSLVEETPLPLPSILRSLGMDSCWFHQGFYYQALGSKLRHEEGENSGLLAGTPSLQKSRHRESSLSHPSHLPSCCPDRKGVSSCKFPEAGFG